MKAIKERRKPERPKKATKNNRKTQTECENGEINKKSDESSSLGANKR
jgi:hypothetical protein